MPKGTKLREPEPPRVAHCDFCGRPFGPVKWNQRTDVACAVRGCPDQSAMPWRDYVGATIKLNQARRPDRRTRVSMPKQNGGAILPASATARP